MLVSQLWVAGEYGRRRPDLVGFLNGIPVLLFELKKPKQSVEDGATVPLYYENRIPELELLNDNPTRKNNGMFGRI